MSASKSRGTWQQYQSAFKKWSDFCDEKNWSVWDSNLNHYLVFLTDLFEKGHSYSSVNTCRSALSSILSDIDGVSIGQHKLIVSFMKGVSRLRPAAPRYSIT